MSRRLALLAATALLSGGLSAAALASPSPTGLEHRQTPVCGAPAAGFAACHAIRDDLVESNGRGNPDKGKPKPPPTTTDPRGLHPADIQAAYNFIGATSTRTVAIVDAYDDPTAEADLAVYRSQFGLPACTTANGCFKKLNQNGVKGSYPSVSGSWAQEISLDLDMVSAACPTCHILLVEANSASFTNLAAAVNTAAAQSGVAAISNSYGGSDFSQSSINGYDHPGIAITASTGDSGYGVQSPASFDTVVAVGGTSLSKNASNAWTETAWSGAGSGCSTRNAKPAWQTDATQCSGKAVADVSAVADPYTGVSVYDSTAYQGVSGWLVFGGTSASSPIIASAYAMGDPANLAGYPARWTWGHSSALHDVTSGSNGSCSPSLWCHGAVGWDGPTGLGTPNGLTAF